MAGSSDSPDWCEFFVEMEAVRWWCELEESSSPNTRPRHIDRRACDCSGLRVRKHQVSVFSSIAILGALFCLDNMKERLDCACLLRSLSAEGLVVPTYTHLPVGLIDIRSHRYTGRCDSHPLMSRRINAPWHHTIRDSLSPLLVSVHNM